MSALKLLAFAVLIVGAHSWYKCDDKEFCKNIRNKDPKHHFNLLLDTAVISDSSVEANLENTETKQILKFKITGLENDVFRLQIEDPAKRRHSVPEALDGEPATKKIAVSHLKNDIQIQNGESKANINASPFTILISNKQLGITINEGGRMEFISEDNDEAIAMDFKFAGATAAYGIPEHGEKLALKSSGVGGRDPYRLFNIDYPGYETETPDPLYGAVPVLYAHGTKHTSGVFWLNSAQTFVDLDINDEEVNALFISESGVMDIFILPGPTLQDSVKQYSSLTGPAPLPPLFSMGYHQSRWSYETQEDLETVIRELDNNDFPTDVMWLDIAYTEGKKYFTWNFTAFPKPEEMQARLLSTGRKLVVIIDPHIKVETGYFVYDQGLEYDHFVKNEDGSVFEGSCWPGLSSYVDFTKPDALKWWSSLFSYDTFPNMSSIVHVWNDMNEPSVFDVDEKTMWNSIQHYDGWTHRDIHNMYGFMQTKGTFEGLLARHQNKLRPFVLTRSHFAGNQRYSAIWTGDNSASWNHMQISIPMCLTANLAGISFCGADVGGFVNNPNEELLQRWYQLGAWLPFYRAHSAEDTIRREPYLYPADIQARFRKAMKQRYAHLPYWYTVWYEHTRNKDPVMRPITYHYPEESSALAIDTEFMIGSNILVAPVLNEGQTELEIYLPNDLWYNIDELLIEEGPVTITHKVTMDYHPVYYRGGSIIPRQDKPRPSTVYMKFDPYNLYVYLDKTQEKATGNLYVDDFESHNYREKEYVYMEYTFEDNTLSSRKIDEDATFYEILLDSTIIIGKNIKYTSAVLTSGETIRNVDLVVTENSMIVSNLNIDMSKEFKIKFY